MTWRAALYFFFGCFLGGYAAWANAGYALASPPGGMGFVPGVGYTWKPPVSTPPANGTWTAHGFVKYAGKNIPLPASWGVAANGGNFVKSALRLNPAWFVGTTVAAIALDAGLEYLDNQWQVYEPPVYDPSNPAGMVDTLPECPPPSASHPVPYACVAGGADAYGRYYPRVAAFNDQRASLESLGWVAFACYNGTFCIFTHSPVEPEPGTNAYRPATEDDWQFPVGPLTDTQLDEFSTIHPQGLPVTNPVLEPVTEQIGQPYTDPVTGEQWRDMLRITPDPTASSPTRVRIDEYREPMTTPAPSPENPDPAPEPDPTRNPEELPPELPLFCDWAGVVCDLYEWFTEPFEEPEAVEVPYLDDPEFDSSPLSLPSSGSCPPPQSLSLGLGSFALEFTPMCDLASAIRPLVLAAAFLLAAFIVVGVRR